MARDHTADVVRKASPRLIPFLILGLYGIGFWMPQVLQTFGLSNLSIGFLTAIPYSIAAVGMVIAGSHSDRTGERILHVALPLFVSSAAFAWSAYAGPLLLVMLALSLATLGIYAAIGTFWSLPTSTLTGSGAAAGLALINSIGNCGGFAGPIIVGQLKGAAGNFTGALLFLAGALACGGALALHFGQTERLRRRSRAAD